MESILKRGETMESILKGGSKTGKQSNNGYLLRARFWKILWRVRPSEILEFL